MSILTGMCHLMNASQVHWLRETGNGLATALATLGLGLELPGQGHQVIADAVYLKPRRRPGLVQGRT